MTICKSAQTFIFSTFLLLITALAANGAEATFSWTASTEPISGYKIHYGTSSQDYNFVVDVGLPIALNGEIVASVDGLLEGTTYYFAATAYSLTEESDYSTEVEYTVPEVPTGDAITREFGNSTHSDVPGAIEETFTNINSTIREGSDTVSTWSWSSPTPHKIANTIILKADLSSIPSSAIIEEASLTLYQTASHGESVYSNSVHRIAGRNPVISEVSGYNAAAGLSWSEVAAGTTYDSVPLGLADIGAAEDTIDLDTSPGYKTWSITAMVRDWVSNPSVNFGLLIKGEETNTETGRTFAASEYSDGNMRPSLTITYRLTAEAGTVPTANDIALQGPENSEVSSQLNVDNPDGNTLVYKAVTQPINGTLTIEESTGSFTYSPASNYFGIDSFTYNATNDAGTSNTATVSLTINLVNNAPVASSAAITIDQDTSHSGQLSATDSNGDILTYSLVSSPTKGTTSVGQDGTYTYSPQAGAFGSDSFAFKVSDGFTDSNSAIVTITITPITSTNDAPVAKNSAFSLDQGSVYNGQLDASDANGDSISFFMVTTPAKGSLSIADNGSFTYTPTADATGNDGFTFKASDGSLDSNTGIVDIIINETANNDPTNDFAFEVGELQVTSAWQPVIFETAFVNPAVVAKAGTMNDVEPSTIRIRNLTSNGFDIRIQEWDYLDGVHPTETVTFMAMEQGYHQMADNVQAIAGCNNVSGLNSFHQVDFSHPLPTKPVVLASVVTENEHDAIALRMKNITGGGFAIALQEQESNDGTHAAETTCFIALEEWAGTVDNFIFEVAATDDTLTNK